MYHVRMYEQSMKHILFLEQVHMLQRESPTAQDVFQPIRSYVPSCAKRLMV